MAPVVAIVGRPNVGKSTLFNRICGERKALVDDTPGVTRDRLYARATWNGKPFVLVDTGGLEPSSNEPLLAQIRRQTEIALQEADVLVFVLDASTGVMPSDREAAELLRRSGKPIYYVVNKVDGPKHEVLAAEFFLLGASRLYPISALHGRGISELLDDLTQGFPDETGEPPLATGEPIKVAVLGRPNVGKSSLLNRLCGEERALVSPLPGTTRDAVDTVVKWHGKPFLLVDTAGIRRRSKIGAPIERFSILKALRSLERCHVALLVMDAMEGPTDQDAAIGQQILEAAKGCVLLLNKWDLVPKEKRVHEDMIGRVREKLPHLEFAPVLTISALTGLRVDRIFRLVEEVFSACGKRIATSQLNERFREWIETYSPPAPKGRRVKLFYVTQVGVHPPTFVVFANHPEALTEPYKRYLVRKMREEFNFSGATIRIHFKERGRKR